MDKKLSRVIAVLDALEGYFESLQDYLKQTDHAKFTRLKRSIDESTEFKTRFVEITRGTMDDAALFQTVHLYTGLSRLLQSVYHDLDFRLPVGEEISKTRAYRLTEVFNRVTTIYRLYVRDIQAELGSLVRDAGERVKTTDPLEIQRLWQLWPNSIDLYTVLVTRELDAAYKTGDKERQTLIFEILETDKRFILNERQWISAFLSFNCVPETEFGAFKSVANALDSNSTASKPRDIAKSGRGVIVVTRRLENNTQHKLPTGVEWGPGITENDIRPILVHVPGDVWKWQVEVLDEKDTREYAILETIASDMWRILKPWKRPTVWIPRDTLIIKIKEEGFGRPLAYHALLNSALERAVNTRVANLVVEKARPVDVGLNVLRIEDLLMSQVKREKGAIQDRLESEALDKIFETAILGELHDAVHLLDALLYWTEWSRRDFRKELDLQIARNHDIMGAVDVDTVLEHKVRTILHDIVAAMLKKTDNIFQDLIDKQHKLDVVKMNT